MWFHSDPHKYAKLRENAKYSVISCEQVAQAWLIEFCRLRRKLPVNYSRLDELSKKYASTWDPVKWIRTHGMSPTVTSLSPSREVSSSRRKVPSEPKATVDVALSEHLTEQPHLAPLGSKVSVTGAPTNGVQRPEKPELMPVRIRFCHKREMRPRAVAVSGSFDEWQVRRPMAWDNALQAFSISMALHPGRYVYKLIVDGDWTLNPEAVAERDSSGNVNNILLVE